MPKRVEKNKMAHTLRAELEVELPGRPLLWVIPIFICQRYSDLYDLEQVDVTPHRLVVVVR